MKYDCCAKTKILGSVREMGRSFVDEIAESVYSFDRLTPFRHRRNITFSCWLDQPAPFRDVAKSGDLSREPQDRRRRHIVRTQYRRAYCEPLHRGRRRSVDTTLTTKSWALLP